MIAFLALGLWIEFPLADCAARQNTASGGMQSTEINHGAEHHDDQSVRPLSAFSLTPPEKGHSRFMRSRLNRLESTAPEVPLPIPIQV